MTNADTPIEARLEKSRKAHAAALAEVEKLNAMNEELIATLSQTPPDFQKEIGYTPERIMDPEKRKEVFQSLLDLLRDKKIISNDDYKELQSQANKNPSTIGYIIIGIVSVLAF
jgi:hypothetical protein